MSYDVCVIGAGIVGLASALKVLEQKPGLKVVVLDKEKEIAKHQTGHNSGVIHSGVYYKPGSLKAQNCIRGYHMLLEFCQQEEVDYEICGKVIVATNENERHELHRVYERGQQNGLEGLQLLNTAQIKEREPHIAGIEGIFVPQTGIVDYKAVCEAIARKVKQLGGEICLGEQVVHIRKSGAKVEAVTPGKVFEAKVMVTCAGLFSDKVAAMTHPDLNLRIIPFRGEYYEVVPEKAHLVRNLVYPVPDPAFPFLGVHFTRMIKGGLEAGPNAVLAFQREGYHRTDVNLKDFAETLAWPGFQKVALKYWKTGLGEIYRSFSKPAFVKALQKLLPEIQEADLVPGGAGVRAQACDKHGGLLDDFLILESANVVNVCNAPSPAATSSLSIGETVAGKALAKLK